MENKPFVHLHVHTEYSTLDGMNRIDEIPKIAKEMGQSALSITDHYSLGGLWKFYKSCEQADIKPILGQEAYYSKQPRTIAARDDLNKAYYHLILLAQNRQGLQNLFKIAEGASKDGGYYKPRMDDELLVNHSDGIIATSACLGSLTSQLIIKDQPQEALAQLKHYAELLPGRFFVELQLHKTEEQQLVNQQMIKFAKQLDLPIILTNDSHYTFSKHKDIHSIFLKMNTGGADSTFNFDGIDVHLADHDWMAQQAEILGIPYEALTNTIHVANMIDADSYFPEIYNNFPRFKELPENIPSWIALERLSKHYLKERLGGKVPTEYKKRLEHELQVIKRMGFSDYMLIMWRHQKAAREELGILIGPGRGSSAGSLVAWALRITDIDPIKYGLLFSRFLNEGRAASAVPFTKSMKKDLLNLFPEHTESHTCSGHHKIPCSCSHSE